MSDLKSWAEREVEIACKRENPDRKEGEWDYGCACYESALKAFNSLLEDGHSGMSIGFTKNILMRLIDGKPLTPIEDTDDVWNKVAYQRDDKTVIYQNKRMSALFKNVRPDGSADFNDTDRFIACAIDDPHFTYYSVLVNRLMKEMYPVTMPYMPPLKPYIVYCEEFLTDRKNGDFDTVGIFYCKTPEGDKVEINRYFKDGEEDYIEISKEEYDERKTKGY